MAEILGFWGMIFTLIAFFVVGFVVAASFSRTNQHPERRIIVTTIIHVLLFGTWMWLVLDDVGSKYRLVPWWYLGYWIFLFAIVNLWFIISSFKFDWSKATGLALAHFIRRGGFWGNRFSGPDNTKYPGTRNNFWGNCSAFIWCIVVISFVCSRSPWHKDLKDEQKWLSKTAKNTTELVAENASKAESKVLTFLSDQFKDTNTPIEKWVNTLKNDYNPYKRPPKYKIYTCTNCLWEYFEGGGFEDEDREIYIVAGTQWSDVPPAFTCPRCSSKKETFRIMKLLPVYPGTWGWLVAFILWTIWAFYAMFWSRRDWTADRLEQFTNWLSRKKPASVVSTVVSGALAVGATPGAEKAKPHVVSERTTSITREIGKEVVAEATVDATKEAIIRGVRGLAAFFKKR